MFRGVILLHRTIIWILFSKVICDSSKCRLKLLNDYQSVPDSAFSATSYFITQEKKADFSAKAARESYDKENEEFAWCPLNQVQTSLSEYLQIDLGRLTMITVVQTKGRFAQGSGKEFTPLYQIRYSRNNGSVWRDYKKFEEKRFEKILKGPTDAFIDAFETLDPPIIARIIRIFPYSKNSRRVCLKLQLFGCTFTNDILEYRTNQGSPVVLEKNEIKEQPLSNDILQMFRDNGYDGHADNGRLVDGLGLLTDFNIGVELSNKDNEAFRFLGWEKTSYYDPKGSVSIEFFFENRRNFSLLIIHSFSKLILEIDYFSKLDIAFSDNGKTFEQNLEFESHNLKFNEVDHSLNISLNGHTGKFVNLTFYFKSRWFLLSEIFFISNPLDSPDVKNSLTEYFSHQGKANSIVPPHVTGSVFYRISKFDISTSKFGDKPVNIEIIYLLTILLCLLLGIITAFCSFWIIIKKRRSHRRRSIKKQAMALCSQASFIPYNHNSKTIQCVTKTLPNRPAYPSFTVDRLNYPNDTLRNISHITGSYLPQSSSLDQNGFMSKQSIVDANIYTSIIGSDNDSSLSPEYATTSITNETPLPPANFENCSAYLPPPIEPIRPQIFNDRNDCPSFYYPHPSTIPNIQDPSNINFWRFNGHSIPGKGINISSQMSFNDFSKDVLKVDQQSPQDNLHTISSIYSDLPRINSHY